MITLKDMKHIGAPTLAGIDTGGVISVTEGKIVVDTLNDAEGSDEAVVKAATLAPAHCGNGDKVFVSCFALHKNGHFFTYVILHNVTTNTTFAVEYGMLMRTIGSTTRSDNTPMVVSANGAAPKSIFSPAVNKVELVNGKNLIKYLTVSSGKSEVTIDLDIVELIVEAAYHTLQNAIKEDELGYMLTESDLGSDIFVEITESVYRRLVEQMSKTKGIERLQLNA